MGGLGGRHKDVKNIFADSESTSFRQLLECKADAEVEWQL